jgi:tol-pal system protein YbgF
MMNRSTPVIHLRASELGFVLVLLLVSGCAHSGIEALSQKTADQQRQIGVLQRDNIELKSRIEDQKTADLLLEKRLKENSDRMGEIQARLQALEINTGEIRESLDEMKISWGKAVQPRAGATIASSHPAPSGEAKVGEAPASMSEKPGSASTPPSEPQAGPAPPPGALGSEELYNHAMKLLKGGEPGQAILEFEKYVQEFPNSELADNAQYWIGEAYYLQREYDRAVSEFQKVRDNYPRGDKVPDALLKIGLSYLEMGKKEQARVELKKLIAQYPDSPPASLARKKLAQLPK